MPQIDRDPIQSVKAFLQREEPFRTAAHRAAGTIALDLREIQERLTKARKVEQRVSLSEAMELLVEAGRAPLV